MTRHAVISERKKTSNGVQMIMRKEWNLLGKTMRFEKKEQVEWDKTRKTET